MSQPECSDKVRFRQSADQLIGLPVFFHPIWLDTVLPKQWDVRLAFNSHNRIEAVLTYRIPSLGLGIRLKNPVLTPFWGIWVSESIYKNGRLVSKSRQLIYKLIDLIPKQYLITEFHLSPTLTDALPFEWRGFQNRILYTFRIPADRPLEDIWKKMSSSKRRAIKVASNILEIGVSNQVNTLNEHIRLTYREKGMAIPFPESLPSRIHSALSPLDRSCLLVANDGDKPVGSLLLVWDNHVMYNLLHAIPSCGRSIHAGPLLLWKAIQMAHEKKLIFDFEGSIIQNIAIFYQEFGAIQTPYLSVIKGKTTWLGHLYQTLLPRLR